jgi:NAD(P)-dependent dehydrogenase (short-subunit alcohol dehydrogenase family)
MDLQLQGKCALITGSSSGIGEGIAHALAKEGAIVVVHGREQHKAQPVAEAIMAQGGTAFAVGGDVATNEGAEQVLNQALASVNSIDILINNASAFSFQGWSTATPEDWLTVYNGTVPAAVRLIRGLSESMKARGWGRIIQIASDEAMFPSAQVPLYAAAKAALVNLTLSLSKELVRTGVTVNAVSPGPVTTQSFQAGFRQMAAQMGWGEDWSEIEQHLLQQFYPNSVGRLGRVEDIAALVTFLSSPLSGYITGANYRIDGGYMGTL